MQKSCRVTGLWANYMYPSWSMNNSNGVCVAIDEITDGCGGASHTPLYQPTRDTTIHCYETHKPLVEESYNDRTGVVTDINIAFGMYTEHPLVQNTMYMYMQSS